MYSITGTLHYYHTTCNLLFGRDLADYYRALLPKAWYVKPPRTESHISVVRPFESPNMDFWKKYEQEKIAINYWLPVNTDGIYFWLDCSSPRLVEIRRELRLVDHLANNCFHCTIGNTK